MSALLEALEEARQWRARAEKAEAEWDEWKRAAEANMATAERMAEAAEDEGHSAAEWRAIFEERKRADEARLEGCRAALDDMTRERDEARAMGRCEGGDEESGPLHYGARRVCGQCYDSLLQHLRNEQTNVARLRDELLKALDEARADNARLREALEEIRERVCVMGVGEESDSVDVGSRLVHQSEAALSVIDAALSDTDSSAWLRALVTRAVQQGAYRTQFADFNEDEIVEEVLRGR